MFSKKCFCKENISEIIRPLLAAQWVKDANDSSLSGYSKAVVVAHDWGGAVAWQFAMKYPEMVEKLINCNIPHPKAMRKFLQKSWKQFLMSW